MVSRMVVWIEPEGNERNQPVLFLLLFPTWAWKPLLMGLTERLDPHDSHDMKKIRFSFVRSVSGDLHVLQVTYSTEIYISLVSRPMQELAHLYTALRTFSTCFCWKRPLMTKRPAPSTEPVVPISANKNWITCFWLCRCIRLQISVTFANMDFLFPSRWMDGGGRLC